MTPRQQILGSRPSTTTQDKTGVSPSRPIGIILTGQSIDLLPHHSSWLRLYLTARTSRIAIHPTGFMGIAMTRFARVDGNAAVNAMSVIATPVARVADTQSIAAKEAVRQNRCAAELTAAFKVWLRPIDSNSEGPRPSWGSPRSAHLKRHRFYSDFVPWRTLSTPSGRTGLISQSTR